MTTNKRQTGRILRNMLKTERKIMAAEDAGQHESAWPLRKMMNNQARRAKESGVPWGKIMRSAGK